MSVPPPIPSRPSPPPLPLPTSTNDAATVACAPVPGPAVAMPAPAARGPPPPPPPPVPASAAAAVAAAVATAAASAAGAPPPIPARPPPIPPRPVATPSDSDAAGADPQSAPVAIAQPAPVPAVSASSLHAASAPPSEQPASALAPSQPAEPVAPAPTLGSSTLAVAEDGAVDGEGESDGFVLSPKVTLDELLQKDSEDAAMARYKASLLGAAGGGSSGSADGHPRARFPSDPRVVVLDSVRIETDEDRPPIVIDLSERALKSKPYVLKEGTQFSVVLVFAVQHDLVTGLRWTSSVHKYGVCVDKCSEMLGSFAPSNKLITHRLPEEEAPSGMLARGSFTARAKLTDDDGRTHAEIEYSFDIKKNW